MLHRDAHNLTVLDPSLVIDGAVPVPTVEGNTPCVLVPVQEFDNATCAAQFPSAYVYLTGLGVDTLPSSNTNT